MKKLKLFILGLLLLPALCLGYMNPYIAGVVSSAVALTIDMMEYATDGAAQSAYPSSDTTPLQSYSEDTIITQGSNALKLIATTDALNETVTKTLTGGDILDLTGKNTIKFDARSTGTGSNLQASIHDAGGTTSTYTIPIASADTYEAQEWDISAIADASKDNIDQLQLKVLNAGSARTFYIDNMRAE